VLSDALRTHRYDVSIVGWVGDYLDPSTFLDLFRTGNGNNYTGWTSTAYDGFINDALKAGDAAVRYPLYHRAEQLLMNEMPVAPLIYGRRNYGRRAQGG